MSREEALRLLEMMSEEGARGIDEAGALGRICRLPRLVSGQGVKWVRR